MYVYMYFKTCISFEKNIDYCLAFIYKSFFYAAEDETLANILKLETV